MEKHKDMPNVSFRTFPLPKNYIDETKVRSVLSSIDKTTTSTNRIYIPSVEYLIAWGDWRVERVEHIKVLGYGTFIKRVWLAREPNYSISQDQLRTKNRMITHETYDMVVLEVGKTRKITDNNFSYSSMLIKYITVNKRKMEIAKTWRVTFNEDQMGSLRLISRDIPRKITIQ